MLSQVHGIGGKPKRVYLYNNGVWNTDLVPTHTFNAKWTENADSLSINYSSTYIDVAQEWAITFGSAIDLTNYGRLTLKSKGNLVSGQRTNASRGRIYVGSDYIEYNVYDNTKYSWTSMDISGYTGEYTLKFSVHGRGGDQSTFNAIQTITEIYLEPIE